jgi:hypothetical protein
VTVLTGRTVTGIDTAGVTVEGRESDTERIPSRAVVWAAGVTASALAGKLAELTGAERDRAGRSRSSRGLLRKRPARYVRSPVYRSRTQSSAAVWKRSGLGRLTRKASASRAAATTAA